MKTEPITSTRLERAITYIWTNAVLEPWRMFREYGNQALIVFASATFNANFAMAHGILAPVPAWLLAVGYEWTYLRGLADAKRTDSRWLTAVNWTALLTVGVSGVFFVLMVFDYFPDQPTGGTAILLALVHVLPITLLLFFSAMAHNAAVAADREHARLLDEQRATEQRATEQRAADREQRRLEAIAQLELAAIAAEHERAQRAAERAQEIALFRDAEQVKLDVARQRAALATSNQQPQPVAVARKGAQPSNQQPITLDGVTYANKQDAINRLGISRQAVEKRMRKEQTRSEQQ